jgi:prepilin-type N-terminal cleavage/methylation domain-containing protein
MQMLRFTRKQGFSLVELLTVIGIIAVLAAIIFPMANGARRQVAQTNCAQNMHTIIQGLKMYKLDERRYPVALFPWDPEADPAVTGKDYLRGMKDAHGPLFPEYVRTIGAFHCPSDAQRKDDTVSWFEMTDPGDKDRTLRFYYYDSYDGQFSKVENEQDAHAPLGPIINREQFELHYIRDWEAVIGRLSDDDPNRRRQLKWRNPPEDTVVTWCTYHASPRNPVAGENLQPGQRKLHLGSIYLVAYLDGSVRKIPCSEVINSPNGSGFVEPGGG